MSQEIKEKESKSHFPILIAEDNAITRKLLEKILLKGGHEVVSAENGREALELFNKNFFPIILTDWMMPEMNGIELCKTIRESSTERYVFIILLTAKDSKDDIVVGLEAGADDYLTKPINNAELIARLNTGKRILELESSLKEANKEIKLLSITDPLTGCYNRGYLNEQLPQEIRRARRYQHSLSIIFCDIDHFKAVNDIHGHQVGDQVLKEFAKCIKESFRYDVDWLTRYGGEEFLIVLPETDTKGAVLTAERLRGTISQREINVDGKPINITASFGVSGFVPETPEDRISFDAMLNQADKYLYQSKNEGRNRVTCGDL
jgi:diguanylate cyclase (GGDEF)-like protein